MPYYEALREFDPQVDIDEQSPLFSMANFFDDVDLFGPLIFTIHALSY